MYLEIIREIIIQNNPRSGGWETKKGLFRGHGRRRTSPAGPKKSCPVSPGHCDIFCSIVRRFPASFSTSNVYALPFL